LIFFRYTENDKGKEFINHLCFSDYNKELSDIDDYEKLLKRNEMREILNRIHYILKDLIKVKTINNYFCIGKN
jgi:hypothetical protein